MDTDRRKLVIVYQKLERRVNCHRSFWIKQKLILEDDKKFFIPKIEYKNLIQMDQKKLEKNFQIMEKQLKYYLELCNIYDINEKEILF